MASTGPFAAVLLLATVATAGTVAVALWRRRDRPDPSDGLVEVLDAPAVVVADDSVVELDLEAPTPIERDPPVPLGPEEVDDGGGPVDEVFSDYPALRSALETPATSTAVEVSTQNGPREVQVTGVPLDYPQRDDAALFLLQEPSDRLSRVRDLERQNEQLDRFASLVSHDLRNPLDVAIGRTKALDDMNDDDRLDPHLAELVDAHDRMHRIIDDGLALARQGRQVGELEDVELGALAEAAWSRVETADATLEVTADRVILADRTRLERVLENLFRNAVEHGGEDVTVELGDSDEGFFVADDGVGIPPADRERFFKAGETGSEGGTGLGLAIVREIAEAHGWDVSATSSDAGGARFEFAGVEAGDQDHGDGQSSLLWEPG